MRNPVVISSLLMAVIFVALLQWPSSANAPAVFTELQAVYQQNTNCSGSTGLTCASGTLSATQTGSLLIFVTFLQTAGTSMGTPTSVNNTWTHPTGCASNGGATSQWDLAYVLKGVAGDTSFTTQIGVSNNGRATIGFEFSYTGGPIYFQPCGVLSNVASATTQPSPALTLSGNNFVGIGLVGGGATITAAASPFNTNYTNGAPNRAYSWATNLTNSAAASSFNWTTNNGGAFYTTQVAFGSNLVRRVEQ